jgi:hypothetical protein
MIRPIERYGIAGECAVCKKQKFIFEVVGFPLIAELIPADQPPPPRPRLCLQCVETENVKFYSRDPNAGRGVVDETNPK